MYQCKKYSSNTLPHVSRPNWSINVVAGHPPWVSAVFWFPKKLLGNSAEQSHLWPLNCTLASL